MNSDKKNALTFLAIFLFFILAIGLLIFVFGKESPKETPKALACENVNYTKPNANPIAKMSTDKGCIILELYKEDAPKTVDNFIGLAEKGYYDGLKFHRTLKDFVIQGGDPKGDGTGGESIYGAKFEDELNSNAESYKTGYVKGVLAMANSGPDTNGSQFFITVADLSDKLPKNYTIFGKVVLGQDVVDQISLVEVKENASGESSQPVTDVKMDKVEITK